MSATLADALAKALDRITEQQAYIEELEQALEGAIWVEDWEARNIVRALGVTPHCARILLVLYKAKGPLYGKDIDQALPEKHGHERIGNKSISEVLISRMRKVIGYDAIGSKIWSGYWLTERGRLMVQGALWS